jgi:N utilization substance protein A
MNPSEILRIVDTLHRDKSIDPEIVFRAIEAALVTAAKRRYGEESQITVQIARNNGSISATRDGQPLSAEEIEAIGRIGAQTAKQVIIQKIREAERDVLIEEFQGQIGQLVSGIVHRNERGATLVSLNNVEAILPRSEQIPGESYHPNERVRALIYEVRPFGNRVRVMLSRTRPLLLQRLFEQEIPEIAEGVIQIKSIAREPGHRAKVAVHSTDQRVDCVGACVGVRGNRIRNIVEELRNERIDIVRWSDDPKVLITNALQPAEIEQVLLCDMIGRAIVLVRDDQLSLAIGRKGQNVRLASKLCNWDIEVMTEQELNEQIDRAVQGFSQIEGVDEELAQRLVEQGYLSYDDLSVIEPDALMQIGGLTVQQADRIIAEAEARAAEAERLTAEAAQRHSQERRGSTAQVTDRESVSTASGTGQSSQSPSASSTSPAAEGTSGAGEEVSSPADNSPTKTVSDMEPSEDLTAEDLPDEPQEVAVDRSSPTES